MDRQEESLLQRSLASSYMQEGEYAQMYEAANKAVEALMPLVLMNVSPTQEDLIVLSNADVTEEDKIQLMSEFGQSLDLRGVALKGLGKYGEADRDFGLAISIFEDNKEEDSLAVTLHNRGNSRLSHRRPMEAIGDYSRCIEIRRSLFAKECAPETNDLLAGTLKQRASIYCLMKALGPAFDDANEAVGIREALVEKNQLGQFRAMYAMTLYARAQVHVLAAQMSMSDCFDDLEKATDLLRAMIDEGQSHLARELKMCEDYLTSLSPATVTS